ncbi:MAG: radical SAM protein [Candidatus Omnitrophota bacterium]
MKILLVDPPVEQIVAFNPFKEGPAFSLGLLSIDSYLRKYGYDNIELENYFACDWNDIEERLKISNPDIVGISCTTDSRGFCWHLANLAKKNNPKVKVILGNVHATFFPTQIIEHHSVDFCVLAEGEITMLELIQAVENNTIDYSNILGLAWRDSKTGKIYINEKRELLRDLDTIPINTKRRIFINELGKKQANMMSSRGCPFNCGFCSSAAFWFRTWRKHSPERVVEEFQMLVKQGAEVIDIYDDLFTMDLKRAEVICDILIKNNNKTPWYSRARVDCISEKLVDKMISAGCREISFGIESGDPEMIKRINKKINLEEAVKVFQMLHKKNLIARANFMVGNPGETINSVDTSIRLACRMNPTNIIASIARVYPNTMLDREAQKQGLIKEDFWYLDTKTVPYYTVDMTYEQLQALATKMLFKWAANRGPIEFIKMALYNWRVTGTKRSLSFILSWIHRYLRGLINKKKYNI